jgi:hypothetical protein
MPPGGKPIDLSARISATFGPSTIFSPGLPLTPPDPRPIRPFDLNPGQNLQYTPRAYEPFGFPALRAFANQELVRLAIETRKDQIEDFEWLVRPKGRHRRPDNDPQMLARIFAVETFLAKPDGIRPFSTWLRMLLEDVLAIDAATIERRRNLKGDLIGLDIVQGDTIKLLVDEDGRVPLPPAPAYQQIIRGRIWNDLTTQDLIYAPRNLRPGHIYGYSPVEQILVTINTAIGRQTQQLAYFSEGNVPAGFITVPEGWTAEQIRDWQDWMDARLAGNQAERAKLIWAPFGAKYQAFKDAPLKDDFDEWLARVICFCFSLPPTAFVHQVNRSTAQSEQSRAQDEGVEPLLKWVARLLSTIIQEDLGHPDLEFAWDLAAKPDAEVATVYDIWMTKGAATIDEVRDHFNRDPLPDGLGSQPLIFTPNGVIPLAQALANPQPTVPVPSDKHAIPTSKVGKAYNPDEPRDANGEWGAMGSAAGHAARAVGNGIIVAGHVASAMRTAVDLLVVAAVGATAVYLLNYKIPPIASVFGPIAANLFKSAGSAFGTSVATHAADLEPATEVFLAGIERTLGVSGIGKSDKGSHASSEADQKIYHGICNAIDYAFQTFAHHLHIVSSEVDPARSAKVIGVFKTYCDAYKAAAKHVLDDREMPQTDKPQPA